MILLTITNQTSLQPFPKVLNLKVRSFSDDIIYKVGEEQFSKTAVLAIAPEERTQAQWLVLVDWTQVRSRPYVIIDPFDPSGLLYLNYSEYLVHTRTLSSAAITITVIYRPGVVKPIPLPKVPPHPTIEYWMSGDRTSGIPTARLPFAHFSNLNKWLSRNFQWSRDGAVKVNDRNVRGFLTLWSREARHLLGMRSSVKQEVNLNPLITSLERTLSNSSVDYSIARMKISLFVILSYVAGTKLTTTEPLGHRVRLCNGLPKALGKAARSAIRRGSPETIRYWTSLLVSYKAMSGSGDLIPDLSTVSAPSGADLDIGDFAEFCKSTTGFWARWYEAHRLNYTDGRFPLFKYTSSYGKSIITGGANSSVSIAGLSADAFAWWAAPRNYPLEIFQYFGDKRMIALMTQSAIEEATSWGIKDLIAFIRRGGFFPIWKKWDLFPSLEETLDTYMPFYTGELLFSIFVGTLATSSNKKDPTRLPAYNRLPHKAGFPILGRLHAIYEAAGKIRIVAICDYFTQLVCEPIHKYLFTLLQGVPQDGTFDQQAAVDSFAKEGHTHIYSYDLKSATDLIPIELYKEVLELLFGRTLVDLWSKLLTDRWFWAPLECQGKSPYTTKIKRGGYQSDYIKYSRGQPMGALSSWASMALVHHALVQLAAAPYFDVWFTAYRVLGDDIIIAHDKVAARYVELCAQYGITLSLAKSLISKQGVFNFASQTFIKDVNVSTVSLKETLSASTWDRRIALAKRAIARTGDKLTTASLLKRACSLPMWCIIRSEITHGVNSGIRRFTEFILQNPFHGKNPWDKPYIDSLISWLGMIHPKLDKLSIPQTNQFEKALVGHLWREIFDRLIRDEAELRRCISALDEDIAILSWNDDYKVISSPYLLNALRAKLDGQRIKISIRLDRYFPKSYLGRMDPWEFTVPFMTRFPTQDVLMIFKEIQSLSTLPKTWDKARGTDLKVTWACILQEVGVAEALQNIKETEDRISLFKETGVFLRKFPVDKLALPFRSLFLAIMEVTHTVLPFPRALVSLPKGFPKELRQLFMKLRRDQLRREWIPQAPGGLPQCVVVRPVTNGPVPLTLLVLNCLVLILQSWGSIPSRN